MVISKLWTGYDANFLFSGNFNKSVPIPKLNIQLTEDIFTSPEFSNGLVPYTNFSILVNKSRGFAFFSACNIDGKQFIKIPRKDGWCIDKRLKGIVWDSKLYKSEISKFDRGHLTKREDVQWGKNPEEALLAASSTFYYPNAVPQHKNLNRGVWKRLEDYILHTETNKKILKICVFTGPVLSSSDPYLSLPIKGVNVQMPLLFWKVVIFPKDDGNLYKVGFLMSHYTLMLNDGVISDLESADLNDHQFMNFAESGTYQVHTSLIEEIAQLKLADAIDSYSDTRPKHIILREVDIQSDLEGYSCNSKLNYSLENLTL